eukprot:177984_1
MQVKTNYGSITKPSNMSQSLSLKKTVSLRKLQSNRYAIGYKRPRSNRSRSKSEIEPLLPTEEKPPLCDFWKDLRETKKLIFGSWVNLMLVFVPFGIIAHFADWSASIIFFLNFLGMIPLAAILGDATECLADHLGETIGGLLNATFGNAVEVVVMVLALVKAKQTEHSDPQQSEVLLDVVQTSLIGSIFSNSLLVLGCAFLANGFKVKESSFNVTATSANVSLLMISAFVMLLPAAYVPANVDPSQVHELRKDIMMVSRAAAIILMLMYCCLLVFVLHTHKDIMSEEEYIQENNIPKVLLQTSVQSIKEEDENMLIDDFEQNVAHIISEMKESEVDIEQEDEDEGPQLTLIGSMTVLLIATLLVAWLSEYLVDSINPMADQLNMKPAFVGIILLPIVGNAVEHITAIRMALRNKMDVALSIAIGSATQVAMFVVSLAVIVGWIIDLDLSLAFDPFEINLFIYSSIIIFAIVSDGSSNWLEGVMLLGLYGLVAIAVYNQNYCSGITKVENSGVCPVN